MSQTAYDRAVSLIEMPDVLSTKPTTIKTTNPLLGHTGTHIVQTARDADGYHTLFLEVIDPASSTGQSTVTQLVLPDAVCRVIYRQRQALITRSKRKPAPKLTKEQRAAAKLKEARAVIRAAKKPKPEPKPKPV